MMPAEKINIAFTKDPRSFVVCAHMMSISDTWITLGIDYNHCLKAFEGSEKEIYVVEIEQEIAGFVILQMGGTFKGYIQTICIGEAYRGRGLGKKLLQFCEERIY